MKPIEKFTEDIEENKRLAEYIIQYSDKYHPEIELDADGIPHALPSELPSIFSERYNDKELIHRFTFEKYISDRETQQFLKDLQLDAEKFWYLLLLIYDYCYYSTNEALKIETGEKEQLDKFSKAIKENPTQPMQLTLKVGKKNIIIDNQKAIQYLQSLYESQPLTETSLYADLQSSVEISQSIWIWYFAKKLIEFFDIQPQITSQRRKGASTSDKEKEFISYLIYFTGISRNKSYLEDKELLKAILKQYKDYHLDTANPVYLA